MPTQLAPENPQPPASPSNPILPDPQTPISPSNPTPPKTHTNLLLAILFLVIGVILSFLLVITTPFIIIMIIFVIADYSGPQPIPLDLVLIALLLGAIPPCLLLASVFCFKKAGKFYIKQKALSKPPQNSELQPQTSQLIQTQPPKNIPTSHQ